MLLSLAAVLLLLSAGIIFALHYAYRIPRQTDGKQAADYNLPGRNESILTAGGKTLSSCWIPSSPDRPAIIILHGWGASAAMMLPLSVPFHRAGYNILLLDARNHGRSDSDGHSSLPRFADDLSAAIDSLQAKPARYNGKIILMGHSVGAGAALFEASRRGDISAVVSLSAFAHPRQVMDRQLRGWHLPAWLRRIILRYIEWVIGVPYETFAPINTAARLSCPLLLVHGDADNIVPLSDAEAIYANCSPAMAQLLVIPGAGHNAASKIETHASEVINFLDNTVNS